jgi:hypothetical protein
MPFDRSSGYALAFFTTMQATILRLPIHRAFPLYSHSKQEGASPINQTLTQLELRRKRYKVLPKFAKSAP